jgi:hypothetical protein
LILSNIRVYVRKDFRIKVDALNKISGWNMYHLAENVIFKKTSDTRKRRQATYFLETQQILAAQEIGP